MKIKFYLVSIVGIYIFVCGCNASCWQMSNWLLFFKWVAVWILSMLLYVITVCMWIRDCVEDLMVAVVSSLCNNITAIAGLHSKRRQLLCWLSAACLPVLMYYSVSTGNYLYVYFCIKACFMCKYSNCCVPRLCTDSSVTVASHACGLWLYAMMCTVCPVVYTWNILASVANALDYSHLIGFSSKFWSKSSINTFFHHILYIAMIKYAQCLLYLCLEILLG